MKILVKSFFQFVGLRNTRGLGMIKLDQLANDAHNFEKNEAALQSTWGSDVRRQARTAPES
jgi:hypothetical protein